VSAPTTTLAGLALDKWGTDAQLGVVIEELNELAVAASHLRRGRAGALREVCEEVADVEIVIEQLHELIRRAKREDWLEGSRRAKRSRLAKVVMR
jgi:hypothetical protein